MVCGLVGLLLHCSLLAGAEQGQTAQKPADQLLLEIMDLHGQLVTNDVFLAQAKMLGAYLESAQPMEETPKSAIYRKVVDMLLKIKESAAQVPANPPQQKAPQDQLEEKSVFVPGAALLEVFKADSIETVPTLPVIRAYWRRDLAYTGNFLLPDRISEIGYQSRYVARFSFYYEAKDAGDYGFTVVHNKAGNACKVTVGGVDVAKVSKDPSVQGVCTLRKGFHRVEFWLVSSAWGPGSYTGFAGEEYYADFGVKILVPNALDAVALTKDMMLLKADQLKASQVDQGEKGKAQRVPYVDY